MSIRILTSVVAIAAATSVAACSTVQENPNYQYSSKYGHADTVIVQSQAETRQAVELASVQTQPARTLTLAEYCAEQASRGADTDGMGCDTITAPTQTSQLSASVPTDESYNADAMMGTPGYQLYLQEQAAATPIGAQPSMPTPDFAPMEYAQAAPAPQPAQPQAAAPQTVTASGPRAVTYDYSENVIVTADANAAGYGRQGFSSTEINGAIAADAPVAADPYGTETRSYGPSAYSHEVVQGDTIYSLSRRLCVGVTELQSLNGLDAAYSIKIGQIIQLPASRC